MVDNRELQIPAGNSVENSGGPIQPSSEGESNTSPSTTNKFSRVRRPASGLNRAWYLKMLGGIFTRTGIAIFAMSLMPGTFLMWWAMNGVSDQSIPNVSLDDIYFEEGSPELGEPEPLEEEGATEQALYQSSESDPIDEQVVPVEIDQNQPAWFTGSIETD